MKHWISLLVGTLALALATPVHAYLISQGSTLDFSWSSGGGGFDLSGRASMFAQSLTPASPGENGSLNMRITLTNLTVASDARDARLTAWGFGIDPNIESVLFTDTGDNGMVGAVSSDIPSLKQIEVCVYGGTNCNGGANGGIYGNGASDYFNLKVEGNFGSSVMLNPFGFKYQTSNGSFEFACETPTSGSALTCGTPPLSNTPTSNKVSEPGILALLAAVGIAGSVGRRHARARTVAL